MSVPPPNHHCAGMPFHSSVSKYLARDGGAGKVKGVCVKSVKVNCAYCGRIEVCRAREQLLFPAARDAPGNHGVG